MAIRHFIHVLSGYFYGSFFANNGDAALQIGIPHRGGIIQTTHATVDKVKCHYTTILKICEFLVIKISEIASYIGNVAKEPVHDINKVRKLSEQCASIEFCISVPVTLFVIAIVAVPVAVKFYHKDFAQQTLIHHFAKPYRRRRISVLHHAEYVPRHLQRFEYNPFGIVFGECYGFFEYHMFTGFQCFDCIFGMISVGRTYTNYINIKTCFQQTINVGKKWFLNIGKS